MTKCKCETCQYSHQIQRLEKRQKSYRDRKMVDELHSRLVNAEEDASFWKAKYEGTWPERDMSEAAKKRLHNMRSRNKYLTRPLLMVKNG